MFVSNMAFFARISDPAMGGTYMTLLPLVFVKSRACFGMSGTPLGASRYRKLRNTLTNLGGGSQFTCLRLKRRHVAEHGDAEAHRCDPL